jgi:thymidylate synthase
VLIFFLGVPFNIALRIANYDDASLQPRIGEFIHTLVMHIFTTIHFEQLELLSREPKPLPTK